MKKVAILVLSAITLGGSSVFAEAEAPKPPANAKGDEMKAYCLKYPRSLECKPRDVKTKLEEARKLQEAKGSEVLD